jgi:hypothetical protein
MHLGNGVRGSTRARYGDNLGRAHLVRHDHLAADLEALDGTSGDAGPDGVTEMLKRHLLTASRAAISLFATVVRPPSLACAWSCLPHGHRACRGGLQGASAPVRLRCAPTALLAR